MHTASSLTAAKKLPEAVHKGLWAQQGRCLVLCDSHGRSNRRCRGKGIAARAVALRQMAGTMCSDCLRLFAANDEGLSMLTDHQTHRSMTQT